MPSSYHLIVPLPAGRSTTKANTGLLSVLFVPRLDDDGVLTDWVTDWRNWPKVIRGLAPAATTPMRLDVRINGVVAPANTALEVTSGAWASDPPQPVVWDAAFGTAVGGKPIAVRRFRPVLSSSDSIGPVFDAPTLAASLRTIYQTLANTSTPPTPGTVPSLPTELVDAYDAHLAPTGTGDVAGEDTPVDADFHQAITFVQSHPHLLRVLGLVVDLEVTLPPNPGGVTVQSNYEALYGPNRAIPVGVGVETDFWPTTGPGRWADVGPTTHLVEMLDLGTGISALEDITAGTRSPDQVSIATPNSAGLYLTRSGTDLLEELSERFERQEIFEERVREVLNGTRTPPVNVQGDELGVGRRYDVYDQTVGRWFSLWDRQVPEGYRFPTAPAATVFPPDDEGWITYTAMTEAKRTISGAPAPPPSGEGPVAVPPVIDSTELRVSPVLFAWRGWSQAARPPGRAFSGIDGPVDPAPNEPSGMPVQVAVDYEVVDGVLPRLRYTRTYRFRARLVDFAGNSRRVEESTPGGGFETPGIVFGRTSRLPAPVPVRRLPRPVPGWGDTTATLVIRSEPGQSDATVEPTSRLLYPPSASQYQCELHGFPARDGLFTSPEVFADVVARTAASIETQTTTDRVTGELLQAEPDDWTPQIDYLLEPAATGVGLRRLPGADDDTITVALPGSWPAREGVGIEVRAGAAAPTTSSDPTTPAVVVEVPKGITRVVQVASLIDPALIGHWTFFRNLTPLRRGELADTVSSGGHWLFSAETPLTLVHAVRQPLAAPRVIGTPSGNRLPDRTQAVCSGTFGFDVKSTDELLVTGSWTDPIDTPGAPGGLVDRTTTRLLFAQRESYREVVQRPIDETPFETGDTKRHEARITLEAFSRYARYFTERANAEFATPGSTVALAPEGVVPENVVVRQAGAIATAGADYVIDGAAGTIQHVKEGALVIGQVVEVDFIRLPITRHSTELPVGTFDLTIPNGGVPAAVMVDEVLPAFARTVVAGGDSITVEHNGQTVRVWVHRPWFTTGVGELLGVLVGERPDGPVTEVARDPLSPTGPSGPLTVDDFPGATATNPAVDGAGLGVAGHPVAFDDDRGLWFADIAIDADLGYRPFVQLVLVRFQPVSIAGAEIGDAVVAEPVRLGASRTTQLVRSGTTLQVTVTGSELRNEVIARFQESDPDIGEIDLSWHDLDAGVALTPTSAGSETVWTSALTLPVSERPIRLVIEDAELLDRTIGGAVAQARNIAYIEAVDIDGTWTAPPPEPPAVVTGLTGAARSAAVDLSWALPDDGGSPILRYAVERRVGSGAWGDRVTIEPPTTATTISGLTNDTTYGFRVSAENTVGAGPWSSELLLTPAVSTPGPIVGVQARGGHQAILVTWPAPDDGGSPLTAYHIERRTGAGAWGEAETLPPGRRSHIARQLTNGSVYGFRVRGESALGAGPWSDVAEATPAVMVPGQVRRVQGVSGAGSVALRWRPAAPRGSAVVRYRVEQRLDPTASWGSPVIVDAATTSTVIPGLPAGATVGFRVRAENVVGAGAYSTPIPVTVVGGGSVPDQVQGVQVTAGDTSLTVTWLPPGDGGSAITGYEVELRRPNGSLVATVRVAGDQLVHEFTGLTNGAVYGARARAANVIGDGQWSAPAAGSPQP